MQKDFQFKTKIGNPLPFGATKQEGGWNFSVYSEIPLTSLVISPFEKKEYVKEFFLDPKKNKTGSIWHLFIETDLDALYWGWKSKEKILIDPYATMVDAGGSFGQNHWLDAPKTPLAIVSESRPFDWQGDVPLCNPKEELIIYEMHVRGFTQHPSAKVEAQGTYEGLTEKICYLKELGITAVELLPVYEFDETEYDKVNPKTRERLYNYWGYSPLNFFSPMFRYASTENPLAVGAEFKKMVQMLHEAGIEVILDVVFNHTGEGNEQGKTVSWKGFAPNEYYIKTESGTFHNFSGCGNTFHCNNPIVQDQIISALRHWVTEYHVDGFRFDLASILSRGRDGKPLAEPPLLERITQDPILKHSRLIAEPWDAAGLHQTGRFYQSVWTGASRWMEWNDDFRQVVRRFIKGDKNYAGRFATKLCGSQDVYGHAGSPYNGINFITCHDGFTLCDLVSYNEKHNTNNGEQNLDGSNSNDSWNCGTEGVSHAQDILRLRERQMKNLLLALFVSQGVPMLHMGDEYGHTKHGNNNTWCQDNELNWFDWTKVSASSSFFHFTKALIQLRKTTKALQRKHFLSEKDIVWHGTKPYHPDWSEHSHLVAYTLKDPEEKNDLYIAFNASYQECTIELPELTNGEIWAPLVNTFKAPSQDIINFEDAVCLNEKQIKLHPYSAIVLIAKT